ncbi:zinc-binding alcohol dehydrogenase family protein [Glaciimonas sp. PCH181]|uniref:zinc-binding alcohol dehydrogenase family protein n=1 Tax=Glaciimonas sp. PCH181 TaxID=2133943 RepID=UPI000D369D67|nr:zinc-binding alcohol dehydrogenase family protein [Glaciimonas sp. PCH181]PUA18294.1 dehydrogenase [Glaciimonas sp. PCH181]
MKTLVCASPGVLRMEQRPMPVRGPDEVLIRVRRVGICGTDMHIYQGTQPYLNYPRVMGHELAGEVVEASLASSLKAGDTVYVMPYISCGVCVACRKGKTNCCTNIQVLGVHRDGGLTEYLSIPAAFAFKTDGISLDQAAMIEFLAIGAHAVRRAAIAPGQNVLVVGAGPIGIATALFAGLQGGKITMLDTRADRLQFCREAMGIAHAIEVGPTDKMQLAELTQQEFFDVVFDATGNTKAMERGFEFVAHGGTYVLVSIVRDAISFSDPEFHKRETTLLGSRNATVEDFETVLTAMRAGLVPTQLLNTHRTTLDALPGIFPEWLKPSAGVIKALVEC